MDSKLGQPGNAGASGSVPSEGVKIITYDVDEDNLITYREFMSAIKSLKSSLYKRILPRTLSFV